MGGQLAEQGKRSKDNIQIKQHKKILKGMQNESKEVIMWVC